MTESRLHSFSCKLVLCTVGNVGWAKGGKIASARCPHWVYWVDVSCKAAKCATARKKICQPTAQAIQGKSGFDFVLFRLNLSKDFEKYL